MPTKASQLNLSEAIILMVYSAPGIGKTFLAGTAGDRNVIFTDLNGIVTIRNSKFLAQTNNVDPWIEVIQADEDQEKALAYKELINRINWWFSAPNVDLFDTITLDDVDFLRSSAMNHAVTINYLDNAKSQTKTKIGKYAFLMPARQDYGTEMSLVEAFIQKLTALCRHYGKNCIVCAHEKLIYKKDPQTKEDTLFKVVPEFTGMAGPEANSDYFDMIIRMTRIGKGDSSIIKYQCQPDNIISAKDRYAVLKTYEEGLTFPIILKKVKDKFMAVESSESKEEESETKEKQKLSSLI